MTHMKPLEQFLGFSLLLSTFAVSAADVFPPEFVAEFDETPVKRIVVAEDRYFGPPEPVIRYLLLHQKKNARTNHFCVVGYAWPSDHVAVWVHWREEQRLILWDGDSNDDDRKEGLTLSRRNLKLGKDTVEKAEDLNGSTYIVTRAWWQAVSNDCALHGQKFTIKPFARKTPK